MQFALRVGLSGSSSIHLFGNVEGFKHLSWLRAGFIAKFLAMFQMSGGRGYSGDFCHSKEGGGIGK